ncbi:MAG TPA: PaaI family thioesterase [Actinomycetota bacterium]|nr:PaaI family thioesterase [Actinomycetota bacterium]
MLDPATESAMRARFEDADFARWMGLELASLGDGTSEIRLKLEPHHLNPGRIVHGGVVAGMLDVAAGLAHRTKLGPDATHVTVQLHINYLKAAGAGVLIARGTSLQTGRRVGHAEATLLDEEERMLARASATFLIVRPGSVMRERTGDDA